MGHAGRNAYWVTIAFSGLWFLISVAASAYLLGALADGAAHVDERSITELVIGTILVLQPLLIGVLIVRAHGMRMIESNMSVIGRAALPMVTILILIVAVAADIYNQTLIREKSLRQMSTGTITYDCSRESSTVDFNPKQIGPVSLRLTSIRSKRQPQEWFVTWPGKAPIAAANFDVATGSIGGSQGISWTDTNATNMVAVLSFSDIWGPYGTETIWVTIIEGDWPEIQEAQDTINRLDFTCGPNPKTYRSAS